MIELTSTRVDKSTKLSLAPKLKPRIGNRNSKPISKPQVPVSDLKDGIQEPIQEFIVPPTPTPTPEPPSHSSNLEKTNNPSSMPVVQVKPITANLIQVPSSHSIVSHSPSVTDSSDIPSASSIKQLIADKFENGKLSKYEENRRLQLKEKRKRKAVEQVAPPPPSTSVKEDQNKAAVPSANSG